MSLLKCLFLLNSKHPGCAYISRLRPSPKIPSHQLKTPNSKPKGILNAKATAIWNIIFVSNNTFTFAFVWCERAPVVYIQSGKMPRHSNWRKKTNKTDQGLFLGNRLHIWTAVFHGSSVITVTDKPQFAWFTTILNFTSLSNNWYIKSKLASSKEHSAEKVFRVCFRLRLARTSLEKPTTGLKYTFTLIYDVGETC